MSSVRHRRAVQCAVDNEDVLRGMRRSGMTMPAIDAPCDGTMVMVGRRPRVRCGAADGTQRGRLGVRGRAVPLLGGQPWES